MAFRKVDPWLVRDQLKESAPGIQKNCSKQGARHEKAGMVLKHATKQKKTRESKDRQRLKTTLHQEQLLRGKGTTTSQCTGSYELSLRSGDCRWGTQMVWLFTDTLVMF